MGEQLVANPEALVVMSKDPDMVKVPSVLQDLLVRILQARLTPSSDEEMPVETTQPETAKEAPAKTDSHKGAKKRKPEVAAQQCNTCGGAGLHPKTGDLCQHCKGNGVLVD